MIITNTLTNYIDFISNFVPKDIVNNDYLNIVKSISRHLPNLSLGCFEFWFNESQPRVDLNLGVIGLRNEHKKFTSFISEMEFTNGVKQELFDCNFADFLKNWSKNEFNLEYYIDNCWLVFDILDPIEENFASWYYIMFKNLSLLRQLKIKKLLIIKTLSSLNSYYERRFIKEFYIFLDYISPSIYLGAIGIQTNRNTNCIRIYLIINTFEELLTFLKDNNWPGNIQDLNSKLSCFIEGHVFFGLGIDFDSGIQPKIGIEIWYSKEYADIGLSKMTNILVDLGLCSKKKQEAFLNWNGKVILENSLNFQPLSYINQITPKHSPKEVIIRKVARYIKIVYQPDQPLITKGYLGFDRFNIHDKNHL